MNCLEKKTVKELTLLKFYTTKINGLQRLESSFQLILRQWQLTLINYVMHILHTISKNMLF
jgi:hypothetical protein